MFVDYKQRRIGCFLFLSAVLFKTFCRELQAADLFRV